MGENSWGKYAGEQGWTSWQKIRQKAGKSCTSFGGESLGKYAESGMALFTLYDGSLEFRR